MNASSSKSNQIVPGGVDEYIAKFPEQIQTKLTDLRGAILEVAPDATETVSYFGIPGYFYEGYDYNGMFAWFSYDYKNLRLHVRPPVLENFDKEIRGYDRTKSILKFSPHKEVPIKIVRQLVAASLKVMTDK
jgi:uncharacterized protein YdhG (YjbR/CyaY superfamily)